jgi:PBSX family phage terminase large subunit
MATVMDMPKEQRPYKRYGAALTAWKSRRRELLLSGPAGTGKSRSLLEKLHFCADKYPGMRGLIVRKTRASITQTAMVTFEQKVLPEGWLGGLIRFRTAEQEYRYPNGSIIAVGGMDKATKVMSSEWDMIYVQEAIELTEEDWESLTTRLRNNVMPYQQIMADCNPSYPTHWLKQRCDRGATLMLESRHEDNPSVTPEYLATLDALTGVRYLRLRKGLWAAAEGLVYEEYDPAVHIIDRFPIPASWSRYWSVDFGYRNPFVWQAWAENPDGVLFRYREIYKTQTLVEDHAKLILQLTANESPPEAVICDHDAEDRATFEKHTGYQTIAATKAKSPGIQEVQSRLRKAGNNMAGVYFLRDSLVERDPILVEKNAPSCTEEEFESYVWDVANGRKSGEEPVKKDDHGVDSARYMAMYLARPLAPLSGEDEPIEPSQSTLQEMQLDPFKFAEMAGIWND